MTHRICSIIGRYTVCPVSFRRFHCTRKKREDHAGQCSDFFDICGRIQNIENSFSRFSPRCTCGLKPSRCAIATPRLCIPFRTSSLGITVSQGVAFCKTGSMEGYDRTHWEGKFSAFCLTTNTSVLPQLLVRLCVEHVLHAFSSQCLSVRYFTHCTLARRMYSTCMNEFAGSAVVCWLGGRL